MKAHTALNQILTESPMCGDGESLSDLDGIVLPNTGACSAKGLERGLIIQQVLPYVKSKFPDAKPTGGMSINFSSGRRKFQLRMTSNSVRLLHPGANVDISGCSRMKAVIICCLAAKNADSFADH